MLVIAGTLVADEESPETGREATNSAISAFTVLALQNNPDLADLRESIAGLEETYAKTFDFSDSSVSVTGGYAYNNTNTLSGSATLSVHLLPQLAFSLQGDTSGTASLSFTLTPLAEVWGDVETELQLTTQRLAIAHKELELQWQARIALLQYAAAKKRLSVEKNLIENKQNIYNQAKRQFEAGYISALDLRNAADDFTSAAMNHIDALLQTGDAEKALYLLCGTGVIPENILNINIAAEQIDDLISVAESAYKEISEDSVFTSQSTQVIQIQKYYLERQLAKTWLIEPGLTATLSGSLSGLFVDVSGTAGATVSLTLSGASFHFDDIQDLQNDITDLGRDLAVNQLTLQIDEQSMLRSLDSAQLSAEMIVNTLKTLFAAQEQAALDFERGDISEYEYRDIDLNITLAEVGYLDALIAVYDRLGALLQSHSGIDYEEYGQ